MNQFNDVLEEIAQEVWAYLTNNFSKKDLDYQGVCLSDFESSMGNRSELFHFIRSQRSFFDSMYDLSKPDNEWTHSDFEVVEVQEAEPADEDSTYNCYVVFKWKTNFYKFDYIYYSYDRNFCNSLYSLIKVKPIQKLVTVYEA